jgi:hypothetical protein
MSLLKDLWVIWWFGIFASLVVLWLRAGLTKTQTGVDWRQFLLPNLEWLFVYYLLKSAAWPVVLGRWVRHGRPSTPWRAVTRQNGREVRAIVRVAR